MLVCAVLGSVATLLNPVEMPPIARSEHEALGVFCVHLRRAAPLEQRLLAVVGVRHPRPPACHRTLGRLDAEILWHGPPPAFARGQGATGGAEAGPQVEPGVMRGERAAAGL